MVIKQFVERTGIDTLHFLCKDMWVAWLSLWESCHRR